MSTPVPLPGPLAGDPRGSTDPGQTPELLGGLILGRGYLAIFWKFIGQNYPAKYHKLILPVAITPCTAVTLRERVGYIPL